MRDLDDVHSGAGERCTQRHLRSDFDVAEQQEADAAHLGEEHNAGIVGRRLRAADDALRPQHGECDAIDLQALTRAGNADRDPREPLLHLGRLLERLSQR